MKKMTSEEGYGIQEQPSPTCPMIDALNKNLRDAWSAMKGYYRDDDSESLRSRLAEVEFLLFGAGGDAEARLEAIRDHVERVRLWGQEWKEFALSTLEGQP